MLKKIGTYLDDDVIFLLKEINIENTSIKEKEDLIQSNKKHYSEMISKEYLPKESYMKIFYNSMELNKEKVAKNIIQLSNHINKKFNTPIIVSLARAGTPIGVLLKRTLTEVFNKDTIHYTISIIRDKGIDINALNYIIEKESKKLKISKEEVSKMILFVDGWTGKGVIKRELDFYIKDYNKNNNLNISSDLFVLVDICGKANVSASEEDYFIPSSALNSTISGLVSRTILTKEIIDKNEFHGCKVYNEFKNMDLSLWYIEEIMKEVKNIYNHDKILIDMEMYVEINNNKSKKKKLSEKSDIFMKKIQKEYNIKDINHIKPGIGETTRVLLRRIPDFILVKNKKLEEVKHIIELSKEKNVTVIEIKDLPFNTIGIIKEI